MAVRPALLSAVSAQKLASAVCVELLMPVCSVLVVHLCVLCGTACMAVNATAHILECSSHCRTPSLHNIAKYVNLNSIQASDFQPIACMEQTHLFLVALHTCHLPHKKYICFRIPLEFFWVCGCSPCLQLLMCIHVVIYASRYFICLLLFVRSRLALPKLQTGFP